MRTSALEQLGELGTVFIQKKGGEWLVEHLRKDEYGFFVGRTMVWGRKLDKVLNDLLEKVTFVK
jgi:hypothetical protein